MKTKLLLALFVIGIAIAAYVDLSKKDPEWTPSTCNQGLESSVHQREKDGTWVVGIKNRYPDELKTFVNIQTSTNDITQVVRLRPAEIVYLDASKIKNPEEAKVKIGPSFIVKNDTTFTLVICDRK